MLLQSWTEVTINSLQTIWSDFLTFLPNLIGALIIFFIGWAVAVGLQKLIVQVLRLLRIDPALEKLGVGQFFEKAGIKMDFAGWVAVFVKWFLVLAFLLAATDILGLGDVSLFLRNVLSYVPNVMVSVLMLALAFWLAGVLQKIVQASVSASNIKAAAFLGTLTHWAILIFGIFAALIQLGVAFALLQTLVTGLIAMFAIAGGLAFGLGGKEEAADLLRKFRKQISE